MSILSSLSASAEIRQQLKGIKQTIEAGKNGAFQILDNGDGSKFLLIPLKKIKDLDAKELKQLRYEAEKRELMKTIYEN